MTTESDFPVSIEVFHSAFDDGFRRVAYFAIHEDNALPHAACERAYEATNTVRNEWWFNENVHVEPFVLADGGCRSTSVDDYMRITWMKRPPTWYRVARCGFEDVKDSDMVEYRGCIYDADGNAMGYRSETMTFRELRKAKEGYTRPNSKNHGG